MPCAADRRCGTRACTLHVRHSFRDYVLPTRNAQERCRRATSLVYHYWCTDQPPKISTTGAFCLYLCRHPREFVNLWTCTLFPLQKQQQQKTSSRAVIIPAAKAGRAESDPRNFQSVEWTLFFKSLLGSTSAVVYWRCAHGYGPTTTQTRRETRCKKMVASATMC